MKYLFIGGCKNGDRIDIDNIKDHPYFIVPELPRINNIVSDIDSLRCDNIKTQIYTRQTIRGKHNLYTVYVLESLTPDDMLELLISSYYNDEKNGVPKDPKFKIGLCTNG